MNVEMLKKIKNVIQTCIKNKSVVVSKDGTIKIVQRYKPGENLINSSRSNDDKNMLIKWIEAITGIKYKCTTLQNEPSCCYNTYVRVINISSAHSKDRVKRYLKYFQKTDSGFIKTSYAEVTFILRPLDKNKFLAIQL